MTNEEWNACNNLIALLRSYPDSEHNPIAIVDFHYQKLGNYTFGEVLRTQTQLVQDLLNRGHE